MSGLRFPRWLLILALTVTVASAALAQSADPLLLRYRFTPGLQLIYRVLSYDSIIVVDTVSRTLARERAELVGIRCDSVLPDSYVMTMVTMDYNALERAAGPEAERGDHPWVGRVLRFRMTPNGRRLTLLTTGRETPATSPGGPVAPLLLPNLGDDTAFIGVSTAFKNDQWLVDNAFPPVMWNGNVFRAVPRRFDTLGQTVVEVELSEVGGSRYQQPGTDNPAVGAKCNGGGSYFLSAALGYPIAGAYNQINNFSMTFPGGHSVNGRHSLGMMFELLPEGISTTARAERLRAAAPSEPNPEKPAPPTKRSGKASRKKSKN